MTKSPLGWWNWECVNVEVLYSHVFLSCEPEKPGEEGSREEEKNEAETVEQDPEGVAGDVQTLV